MPQIQLQKFKFSQNYLFKKSSSKLQYKWVFLIQKDFGTCQNDQSLGNSDIISMKLHQNIELWVFETHVFVSVVISKIQQIRNATLYGSNKVAMATHTSWTYSLNNVRNLIPTGSTTTSAGQSAHHYRKHKMCRQEQLNSICATLWLANGIYIYLRIVPTYIPHKHYSS